MNETKYNEIAEKIRLGIISGKYSKTLPGVYKLAHEFGTTHITVGKAIRVLAKRGILTIIPANGTIINSRMPHESSSNIIAIVSSLEINETMTIREIVASAKKNNFRSIILPCQKEDMDEVFLRQPRPCGYIFMHDSLTPSTGRMLRGKNIPLVSLNKQSDESGISWVDYNYSGGFLKILEKFYERGHTSIACVGTFRTIEPLNEFHSVYKKFMKSKNIFDEALFDIEQKTYPGEHADRLASYLKLLAIKIKKLYQRQIPPSAIFCPDDINIYKLIKEIGVPVKSGTEFARFIYAQEDINNLRAEEKNTIYILLDENARAHNSFEILLKLIDGETDFPIREQIECTLVENRARK